MITTLILLPIIGALFSGITSQRFAGEVALGFTALSAMVAGMLWQNFDGTIVGLQLVERHSWIPAIGAEYLVGIDGLSLLLVILTPLIFSFAFVAQGCTPGFCALMLLM